MKALSKITDNLIGQPMFALLRQARQMEKEGKKIIHFEIGDPSFDSPIDVVNAAKQALDQGLTHYTDSMGLFEFRQAIADYTKEVNGFKPEIDQILVCPANAIIDFVIRCVVNPGQEVIYPDPGFPTYYSVIKYNGMVPIPVALREENKFRMSPEDILEKVTDKTRLIIINTPQNPTGAIMTKEEILGTAKIAQERDVYLLSDEVYIKTIYQAKHYSPSIVDACRERTIILNSLSKIYSMSGWRLGYAIGPKDLIAKMGLLLQTILSCLPAFTQAAGVKALTGDHSFLKQQLEILRQRRDLLVNGLNAIPGISCLVPDGAFYIFPNIKATGMTCNEYSRKLLESSGVCVLPGDCFGKSGEGYIRLCYASADKEMIKEALVKIKKFHQNNFS